MMRRLFSLMVVWGLLRSTECLTLERETSPQSQSSSVFLEQPQSFDLTDPSFVFMRGEDNALHVMNYCTQQEVNTINLEEFFYSMTFTLDGRYLLLGSHNGEKKVSILNIQTWQQARPITKGIIGNPVLTVTPDSNYVLVSSPTDKNISIINLQTLRTSELRRDRCPISIQPTPSGQYALMANKHSHSITAINLYDVQQEGNNIDVGQHPGNIEITLDKKYALVANRGGDSISRLNLQTWQREGTDIPVGDFPTVIQLTLDGKYALVANHDSASISVINLQTWQKEREDIQVERNPRCIYLSPDKQYALVTYADTSTMSIINLTLWRREDNDIDGKIEGPLMEILPNTNKALIYNANNKNISILNFYTWKITPWTLNFYPFYITTFPLSAVERLKKQQNNLFHLQQQNRLTDITIMTFKGRN